MYNTNSYHYQNPSRNYYGNGGQYNGHTSASNRYPSNRQDPYIQNGNSYKSPAHFNKKPYVPQYANQKSLPISKIIIQHCELISEYSETITPLELRKIFDDFIYELKPKPRNPRHMYEIAKVLIDVDGQVLLDPELRDHEFYVLIRNTIRKLLNKWYSRYNGSFLSKHEYITVYNASEILLNMVHNVSNDTEIETLNRLLLNWQLIDSIKNYLDTVSKNGKQLNDPDIDNFDIIIDVLGDYQRQTKTQLSDVHYLFALLEPIVNSICSESYMHAFRLLKPDAKALVGQQKLFLVRCPGYLTSYNGTRQEELIIRLFEIMIPRFDEILNQYVPSIKQWKAPVMRSIHHIVSMLNYGASKYQSCSKRLGEKMSIIDNILIILEEPVMINNIVENLTNQQTILINTICVFMSNIIYDSTILTYLKQKELTPRFTALTQSKNEQIRLNCQMILGYIMKEDDVTDPQKILAKVVDNLKKALNGNSTENIDVLAESLKGLVQHEQIKEEIIRENLLDLIIGCALKFTGEAKQSALETLWSMTFNEQGAEILRNNKLLISNIQALVKIHPTTPDDEGIQKAADGLLWKLQKEAELLAKLPDDEEKVTTKTLVTAADGSQQIITTTGQPVERVYQYDIMISYSWADKELCLKIHQFLIDNGYKIWLDLNNMHGPAMSAMAEAVEQSEFILLGMSDTYKHSTNCQAEAEYAFKMKRRLIPLIMTKGYSPDGWLGFLIGSRIYIDFGRYDFEKACQLLLNEIHLQRKQALVATAARPVKTSIEDVPKPQLPPPPPPPPPKPIEKVSNSDAIIQKYSRRVVKRSYSTKSIEQWQDDDVLDFLADRKLYLMMPLCDGMNGLALLQLYKMCQLKVNDTYQLLNKELKESYKLTLLISVYTRFLSDCDSIITKKVNQTSIIPYRIPKYFPSDIIEIETEADPKVTLRMAQQHANNIPLFKQLMKKQNYYSKRYV